MLRWGVLSTARINDRMLDAVARSPRSEIVAVASRTAESARDYARSHDIPVALGSYGELADFDGVDAVYISLPNHLHAEWAVRMAHAGKHVLCEKPLALSVQEVDAISSAAEHTGVIVQEACATRFHPQTARVAEVVRSGELGSVVFASAEFAFPLPSTVDIRLQPGYGGGALWDLGGYPVSLFQAVLGANPTHATGHATRGPSGVDLTFAAQLDYPDGACVQFMVSMGSPLARSARIVGTAGTLELSQPWLTALGQVPQVRLTKMTTELGTGTFGDTAGESVATEWAYDASDVYLDELLWFESIVLDGARSPYALSESRWNVAVLCALQKSATQGRRVAVGTS